MDYTKLTRIIDWNAWEGSLTRSGTARRRTSTMSKDRCLGLLNDLLIDAEDYGDTERCKALRMAIECVRSSNNI